MNSLLTTISQFGPVSNDLQEGIAQKLMEVKFKRKEIILREGDVCNYLFFVIKGLLRTYYDLDGMDVSAQFMEEGDFVISILSFFQRQPSTDTIEALEDCELYALHYNDLMQLYDQFVEFNIIGRKITEYYYCLSEQRVISMRKRSAKEKYLHLLDTHPRLIKNIPLKDLASYLGMTPETLSRMRSSAR